ncbi:uncharacterized protein LOC122874927 isoform X3 [Siniperca chuatsi]|uniref:uncharacterized protein LOC122874927 isoform X3 n=1 Tax=Siniperca chuatsi TaxID=119488 RepID=UPI001CE1FB63|nr:uncharacterized protein LOC122874927 isoform X3 [Siniperca chuatsi]
MDLSADSGTPPTHTTVGGPVLEHELSMSSAHCQTESGGTILLQLLEFKIHLLEAVEELHIRRDAETRFEDQISKLVLEKQELEWEKESLQHQSETVAHQHTESLINVKKQFQAKIRKIEEEKGKYQVSAELKDKEINNLKEKLKSLQLLKYNLEKKSSELEQKLALQSRSKDSHLNQLGEVEKRFSALTRQCAIVKQAHEKLEQNVDEAMNINKKLTLANGKQEATIVSLKKELEEVSKKLIMAKMSSVRHDKILSPTGREQCIQQLQQKLSMETEMNKKLGEENVAVRAEKQEVMRSLQHTQQLLLSQTQIVSRVELELQTQREQYQDLKQEHGVMRKKSKAMEDKVAQLMESFAASKTGWDQEKAMFLDRIKSELQDLQAVKDAYEELQQKHTELSSQAKVQAQHIYELEMRDSSQNLSVSTQIFPTLVEEIRREETLTEPIPSSELPSFGSLQHMAYTQTKNPACLEDTGAVTVLVATGATGGQGTPNHHQHSQFKQPLNPPFSCPLTNNNLFSVYSLSGTTGSDTNILNKYINNSNTSESDPDVVSDLIYATSSVPDAGLLISKGSFVSDTSTVSSHRSINGSVDLLSKEKTDEGNGGMSGKEQGGKDDVKQGKNNREEEEINEEQQWNREEVQGEDAKESLESAGEKRGTLMVQTTDRADRREDSQRSTKDAGDTKQPETETKDRAGGEGTDGAEERGKTGLHTPETPETQIPAQTTDRTTKKSNTQKVIDFMDSEPLLAAHEPSDCSQSLSQKVSEKDSDSSHVNKGYEMRREVHTSDVMQTDEMCDTLVSKEFVLMRTMVEPQALPQSQEISEQESGQLKSLVTDDEDGDSSAYKMREGQSNVDTRENDACESSQEPMEKSNLKDVCVDIKMDTVDVESEVETGSCQERMKSYKIEDAGDAKTTKCETDLKLSVHPSHENCASPETGSAKCYEQSPAKEMLLDDNNKSSLPSNKTYRLSFVWGSAQRKTGSSMSEQSTSDPGGLLGHPPTTIPMFLKSKHNKVPLVITGASDLLNGSGVSGTAASSRRHQQGETCSETATADTESRASLSISSFPVSTSSITVSRLSWQTTPGCSRATTSAAGPSSESDWELFCSQEREDQQSSSFRTQISKIEQFLNTERLRLPKRRRTDN